MKKIGKILFTLFLTISHCIGGGIVVEVETVENKFNPAIMKNVTLALVTGDKRGVLNGSVIPAVDLYKFKFIGIFSVRRKNGRLLKLVDLTLDGCEFMSHNIEDTLSLKNMYTKDLRKSFKNLPKKCPWKKNTESYVNNFYIDCEQWPVYLPEAKFQISIRMETENKWGYDCIMNLTVAKKQRRKFRKKN